MTKFRERIISGFLIIIGLVNFVPVLGVFGPEILGRLYGIGGLEGDLLILIRHRALLFGILGAFIIYSAFKRHLQAAAMVMALASMVSYIALVFFTPEPGAHLVRIAVVDMVACGLLVAAWLLARQK